MEHDTPPEAAPKSTTRNESLFVRSSAPLQARRQPPADPEVVLLQPHTTRHQTKSKEQEKPAPIFPYDLVYSPDPGFQKSFVELLVSDAKKVFEVRLHWIEGNLNREIRHEERTSWAQYLAIQEFVTFVSRQVAQSEANVQPVRRTDPDASFENPSRLRRRPQLLSCPDSPCPDTET